MNGSQPRAPARLEAAATGSSRCRDRHRAAAPARRWRARLALAIGLSAPMGGFAVDRTIIVGGGNSLDNSQAQIELNVQWVRELLETGGTRRVEVYYTDGDDPRPDVLTHLPTQDSTQPLNPLARVFDEPGANGHEWRNHRLARVAGTTEAKVLEPALAATARALARGDTLTIVYNGHGSVDRDDPTRNATMLWGDSRLDVRKWHAILAGVAPEVPVRWVFTQCFSGAFHRLAYRDPARGLELAEGERCGFTAESRWRMAEGCSASVAVGDYRDYTTFFYAALSGRTRQGEPLPQPADRDGDGVVTMREAHLYALQAAYSTDLSRSTSEDYLESWEPWFLRWQPDGRPLPDNEFARIADAVAQREGIDLRGAGADGALRQAREAAVSRHEKILAERRELRAQARALAVEIRTPLLARWPALGQPHTSAYLETLERERDAVLAWIPAHASYGRLRRAQQQLEALETRVLNAARRVAQVDKILRLRHLARLRAAFDRHADAGQRAGYERLVACESAPLPGGPLATPPAGVAARARAPGRRGHATRSLIGASSFARASARP